MVLELRPYQEDVIKAIDVSKSKRQLVVLPTGTGKTIVFCELAKRMGVRTLILAHRDELISQAVEKMSWVWSDADIGIVKAERHEVEKQITVASVQSLHSKRLAKMPVNYDLIITDEAHHATASTYRAIYAYMGAFLDIPLHVGVTATPNRTDKKLLGEVYDEVSYEKDILDFIPDYLSDLKIVRRESGIVLDGVKKSVNDLNCNDLSDCLNTEDGNKFVVDTWQEVASDRKSTLVFCADIAHTQGLAKEFRERGIQAWSIDSTMDMEYRRGVLAAFHAGKTQVLLNCGILTEGFDCPQIDCVLLVRPTRSELLLRQMIGRGTRLYPEKENCLILDIACVSNNWDLVSPAKLFGLEKEIEIRSVAEMKDYQERKRRQFGSVEIQDAVAGIYDTRSPGKLYWRKIRWGGWVLRCQKDGNLQILPEGNSLKSINRYEVVHLHTQKIMKWGELEKQEAGLHIARNVPLSMAFSLAESYVRQNKLNVVLSLPNQKWHEEPATNSQKKYIRLLGANEHITPELTKKQASELITFYKDREEQQKNESCKEV